MWHASDDVVSGWAPDEILVDVPVVWSEGCMTVDSVCLSEFDDDGLDYHADGDVNVAETVVATVVVYAFPAVAADVGEPPGAAMAN